MWAGKLHRVLAERYPRAEIMGLDGAPDMVEAARARLPHLHFERASIETWHPAAPFDIILANASLQWVPDHASLYPRLIRRLTPGGTLAVQTPDNLDEPGHRLVRELAECGSWSAKLAHVARTPREGAAWYYRLVRPLSKRVDIWRTIYYHELGGGPAAVVDWFKGSALRPYLLPLTEDERGAFLAQYTESIARAYPVLENGAVLLPFPRLFLVATL
jgi:trans-aconitate 2-methyltransferase